MSRQEISKRIQLLAMAILPHNKNVASSLLTVAACVLIKKESELADLTSDYSERQNERLTAKLN